jgi:hypothetical protein
MDFDGGAERAHEAPPDRLAAVRHQICTVLVAISAWQTAERQHIAWAAATIVLGLAWAWSVPRLVAAMEGASTRTCLRAYSRSFQVIAVIAALTLIYASVALDSAWLWRPQAPADLQAFVWLAVLEFAGLPLTSIAAVTRVLLQSQP